MNPNNQIKRLNVLLANSFNNVRTDIEVICRQINDINNKIDDLSAFETAIETQNRALFSQQKSIDELKEKMADVKKDSLTKEQFNKHSKTLKGAIKKQSDTLKELNKLMRELARKVKSLERTEEKRNTPKTKKFPVKKTKTASKTVKNQPPKISEVRFKTNKKGNPNGEFVEIKGKRDLTGYTLTDMKKKHVFRFPKGFELDGIVRVYSGKGKDTKNRLYWNRATMVWNDDKDIAYLRNKSGKKCFSYCEISCMIGFAST